MRYIEINKSSIANPILENNRNINAVKLLKRHNQELNFGEMPKYRNNELNCHLNLLRNSP